MSVETIAVTAKSTRVGNGKVYDTRLICFKVIVLQASSSEVNIGGVMSHEMSPVPVAIFDEPGEMRAFK